MIRFNAQNHTYTNSTDEKYVSVTTFVKAFEPSRDWDSIAEKYANKNGFTGQYWRDKWAAKAKRSADAGTMVHAIFEADTIEKEANVVHHQTDQYGLKCSLDLSELTAGVYPELMIYSHKYKLAGQSDLVKIYDDKTFEIFDYKTDAEIKTESIPYFNQKTKRKQKSTYLSPIAHLDECNYNKYKLQLSIYANILERYGFKCKGLQVNHIVLQRDADGEVQYGVDNRPIILDIVNYDLEYLKEDVDNLLETIN